MPLSLPLAGRLAAVVLVVGIVAALVAPRQASAQSNTPPVITVQPVGGIATAHSNETFLFTVEATGTPPLNYQWRQDASSIGGATNASLLLTNLGVSNFGDYTVVISNSSGSVTSSSAFLTVVGNVFRRLGTARVITISNQVAVPVTLRANGREQTISFSMQYDTNAFSNPAFVAADSSNAVMLNTSSAGVVGASVSRPPGSLFRAGNQWAGLLTFDLAAGFGPLDGKLAFANSPVTNTALDSMGRNLLILAEVQPQFTLLTSNATLRPQSGLFESRLLLANPGALAMSNVDILVYNTNADSRTNLITFYNGHGLRPVLPHNDPLLATPCDCACGFYGNAPTNAACDFAGYLGCGTADCSVNFVVANVALPFAQIESLQPGESRLVTLEFLVPDHLTPPRPTFSLFVSTNTVARVVPTNAAPVTITTNRYVNGTFLVEFPTLLGRSYFVQYGPTLDSVMGTNARTVLPVVTGTGSRVQWIDNGPPKTDSPPVSDARFYRVLETQ